MNVEVALNTVVFGNSISAWSAGLLATLLALLLVALVKTVALKRLDSIAKRTSNTFDDALVAMIQGTQLWLMLFPALYVGSFVLVLTVKATGVIKMAAVVALLAQLGLWVINLLESWLDLATKRAMHSDVATATSLSAISFVAKAVVWTVVALMVLENLGVDVTALVAGLGIGGIAVALAVQNILGDLFASISIVIDKPFVMGDFIVMDNYMGTVEKVGIKTTRIRSVDGEQIVVTNGDLLKTRIRNYKRMRERRILFGFGVTYETKSTQLTKIPSIVKTIIGKQPQTRFERAHFKRIGESAYEFEVVYWMLQPDFNLYMDTQQAINLDLIRSLDREGIDIAHQASVIAGTTPEPTRNLESKAS